MGEPHMATFETPIENGQEKRRHPRIIKRLPVKFFVDHECLSSLSSDLSESGLFLRTNRGASVDCIIDIQLFLPSNKVSCLKGVVKRTVRTPFSSMKNGMGIEIIQKDEAYAHFIKTLYGDLIKKSARPEFPSGNGTSSEVPDEDPAPKTAAEEKRQHKRLNIELRGMSGKMAFTSYVNIIDISTGGIAFEADRRLNMGRQYTLSILHDKQVIQVKGTVVWSIIRKCEKDDGGNVIPVYKAGMKFSDESRETIQKLIPVIEMSIQEQREKPSSKPQRAPLGASDN